MSKETRETVEAAIRAHIADECEDGPRLVTDWVVLVAHVGANPDTTGYFYEPSAMPWHTLTGLVRYFLRRFESEVNEQEKDQ